MHYKNNKSDNSASACQDALKTNNARRRMRQQLLRMGWTKQRCPYPVNGTLNLMARYRSPHIYNNCFWFENCLKKLNPKGEVYYALEMRCADLEHLTWRCDLENPNNRHPLDTLDAFYALRSYMLEGLPWDYCTGREEDRGIIKIIDWEHPENNTFEFVEKWQGAINDGFGWDFILLVNAIPLCGIVVEDTLQAAYDMAQYQLDNDYQFPVYCHLLVISDGNSMMVGDPWMEFDKFTAIGTLKEALRPVDFLINRIKTIPEYF